MTQETIILNRTYQPRKHTRQYTEHYGRRTRRLIRWRQRGGIGTWIARLLLHENCVLN